MMYKIKRFIRDNETLMIFLAAIYRLFCGNWIWGRSGLSLNWTGVFAKNVKIYNHGRDNVVEFGKGCRLYDCKIQIFGDGNRVLIDHDCVCRGLDIFISDGAVLKIGHNSHFHGRTHFACIEGKTVSIGKRCLFSTDIVFRSGDSHVITDMEDNRINFGRDIIIGDHVWIGQQVVILKGANIARDTIVGTRSLVTKGEYPANVVLAGSPAKVVKEKVNWRPE